MRLPKLFSANFSGKMMEIHKAEVYSTLLPRLSGNNFAGHTTKAPQVGFELATNSIQFYAIANNYIV